MRRFEARWDGALRAKTALSCAFVLALPAYAAWQLSRGGGSAGWLPLLVPGVVLPLVAALAPRAFVLEPRRLLVERTLAPVVVPLADVRAAGLLPDGALRGAIRSFGAAGMFGYFGRYRTAALGPFRLYATRRSGLVVVDTARGRLVLSPEHPERFVEALLASAPAALRLTPDATAGGAPADASPGSAVPPPLPGGPAPRGAPGPRPAPWRALLPTGVVLFPALIAIGTVGAVLARAPRSITATADRIVVERRVGPPTVLRLDGLVRVAPLRPEERRGMRRTSGSAIGGVATGRFHSPALGSFEMFAYRAGPYVLVQLASGTYVLTPDDPEAFVATLRGRLRTVRPRRARARARRTGAPRSRAAPPRP